MDIFVASDSFTRPNDTTTYAAGDAVSNSTSAAVPLEFENVAHLAGRGGVLQAVRILDSAYTAAGDPGGLAGTLLLFSAAPAAAGFDDNGASALTDAEMANVVAVVAFDMDSGVAGNATAGAGGNTLWEAADLNTPYRCASDDTSLYGVILASNAYVPIAQEVFTVEVVVQRETRP